MKIYVFLGITASLPASTGAGYPHYHGQAGHD
jgi:hypothetical protein